MAEKNKPQKSKLESIIEDILRGKNWLKLAGLIICLGLAIFLAFGKISFKRDRQGNMSLDKKESQLPSTLKN